MRLVPMDEEPHECPYLPDRDAANESYFVLEATPMEREALLNAGYRSFGKYVFRPKCQGCHQCVPMRIPVADFAPSKSQRRVLRRCKDVEVRVGSPQYNDEKLAVYTDHLTRFPRGPKESSEQHMRFAFYDPDVPTLEFCYYVDDVLAAVGIVHETPRSLSSVYFTYRLAYSKLSLGVFSVMQEIAHAQEAGKRYLYLGYYIRDNHFMNYKGHYFPNEILTSHERWVPFHDASGKRLIPEDPEFKPFPFLTLE